MAILGGSPLGLIGLKSVSTSGGQSTFNGGASRNVDVYDYNRSRAGSLFTGRRRLRAWPNISGKIVKSVDDKNQPLPEEFDTLGTNDVTFNDEKGTPIVKDGYTSPFDGDDWKTGIGEKRTTTHKGQNVLHNNDVYDTSVLNLVEKLAETKAALRPSDFAYLKDLGVYPNNRLQICRRFVAPSGDNIMVKRKNTELASLATMISWIPENDNFLEISFGEEWEPAKADFTQMLNSLGEDFGKTNLGGIAGAMGGAIPLPGFTEIFQRQFLASMGLMETGAGASIPAGNPNLIKEAKVRKTIGYGQAGSGLKCKVSIKMICEYELKFISGIDPTIVWMDILGTVVRFGTSNSSNYGLSQKVAATLARWSRDPNSLLNDVVKKLGEVIGVVRDKLKEGYEKAKKEALEVAETLKPEEEKLDKDGNPIPKKEKSPDVAAKEAANKVYNESVKLLNTIVGYIQKAIKGSIMKYRVEIMGIVAALTGNPSTPWHITIGNPLRPVFCSGDMLVDETTLKLGPILAFNDLPSNITVEFTVTNARPWGMQEIMAKFNAGYLRTVDIQKTFFETTLVIAEDGGNFKTEPVGILPGDEKSFQGGVPNTVTNPTGMTGSTGGGTGSNPQNAIIPSGTQGTEGTQGTQGTKGDLDKKDIDKVVPGSSSSGTNGTNGTNGNQSKLEGGKK